MKPTRIILATALLAGSTAAAAQTATDARCILLANAFAGQAKDAQQKAVAEGTLYFYLGRINGQPTTAQMKAAMDQEAKTITDANAGTLMQECVKPLSAKIQLLQSLSPAPPPAAQAPAPSTKPQSQPQGR